MKQTVFYLNKRKCVGRTVSFVIVVYAQVQIRETPIEHLFPRPEERVTTKEMGRNEGWGGVKSTIALLSTF